MTLSAMLVCSACGNGGQTADSSADSSAVELASSSADTSTVELAGFPKTEQFVGISPSVNVDIPDSEWEDYKTLGVKSIRLELNINNMDATRTDPANYDKVIKKAQENGIEVLMLLAYSSYDRHKNPNFNETMPDFIEATKKWITHFGSIGVHDFEIWNEENGTYRIDAPTYIDTLVKIYEGAKYTEKWDEEANIIFGGLDAINPKGSQTGENGNTRTYFKTCVESDVCQEFIKKYHHPPFDAVAIHPYDTVSFDSQGNVATSNMKNAIDYAVYDILESNNIQNIPIWITEMGNRDLNDDINASKVAGLFTEATKIPYVTRYFQFKYKYGVGKDGSNTEVNYSIVNSDGTHRKSFNTLKDAVDDFLKTLG